MPSISLRDLVGSDALEPLDAKDHVKPVAVSAVSATGEDAASLETGRARMLDSRQVSDGERQV